MVTAEELDGAINRGQTHLLILAHDPAQRAQTSVDPSLILPDVAFEVTFTNTAKLGSPLQALSMRMIKPAVSAEV